MLLDFQSLLLFAKELPVVMHDVGIDTCTDPLPPEAGNDALVGFSVYRSEAPRAGKAG